ELLDIGENQDAETDGHDESPLVDTSDHTGAGLARSPNIPRFMPKPRRIEILAYADVQLLDVSGPLQVFASANDQLTRAARKAACEPLVVAAAAKVRTSSGLVLETAILPKPDVAVDTLIVPGGWGVNAACEDRDLADWIVRRSSEARRTASVCSGAFLLATAG